MKTINMRVKSGAFGVQYTEEEREEYKAKWANFGQFFARVREKGKRPLRVRVRRIIGPVTVPDPFQPGKTKRVFKLETEFRQPGMEGLTHTFEVTASLDDRSKLHALYTAVTGTPPDTESEYFEFAPALVTTRDVMATIVRQKDRKDQKRGGFFFDLAGFEAIWDELDQPADEAAEDAWQEGPAEAEEAPRALATASATRGSVFDDSDEEQDEAA